MKRRRQKLASTRPSASAPKRQRYNQYYRNCIAASFCPADTSGPRIPTLLRQFSDHCPVKSHRHWLNLLRVSCEKQRCLVRNCATGMHFAQTHGAKSLIHSITMFLTYYVPKKLCVKSDSEWRQLLAALYSFHNYCARKHYIKDDHVLTCALYTLRNFRICTIPNRISELAALRYWHSLEPAHNHKPNSSSPDPQPHAPPPAHHLAYAPNQHTPQLPTTHTAHEATSATTAPPSTPHPQQQQPSPIATHSYPEITHAVLPPDRPVSDDNDVTYLTEATTNTDLASPADAHCTNLSYPAVKAALYNEATSAQPAPVIDAANSPRHQVTHTLHHSQLSTDCDARPNIALQHKAVTADLHSVPHHPQHSQLSHDPSCARAAVFPQLPAQQPLACTQYDVSLSAQVAPSAEPQLTQMQLPCATTNDVDEVDVKREYESHSDPTRMPYVDDEQRHASYAGEQQWEEQQNEATLGGDTPLIVGQVMEDGWLMRSEDFEVDAQYTNAFLHLPVAVAKMGMRGMSLSGLQLALRNGIWRPVLHDNVYVAKAYPPDDIFYY